MIRAVAVQHNESVPSDNVTLNYQARFKRRVAMRTDGGTEFLLDLPKVTDLRDGDQLVLEDGRTIGVVAADEPLLKITAPDAHHLMRLVWHLGNRHIPVALYPTYALIQPDHVIKDMIEQLGGVAEPVDAPFKPEGGAYGHGRTHAHEH